MALNVAGVDDGRKTRRQLKSTLEGFYKLVNNAREFMKDIHFGLIEITPFGDLFWGIYEDKLTTKQLRRFETDLWKILMCFNKDTRKFVFGTESAMITKRDIIKVFNLRQEGELSDADLLQPPAGTEKEFFSRYFYGKERPNAKDIHDAFITAIQNDDPKSAEEAISLMIMYLCVTLFYPNTSATIPRYIARRCMILENVNKYDWAKDVCEKLVEQLSSKGGSEACVNGCVMALLYWFCDISKLIEPINRNKDEIASFLKWNLGEIHFKLENIETKEIKLKKHIEEEQDNVNIGTAVDLTTPTHSSSTPVMQTDPTPVMPTPPTPAAASDSDNWLSLHKQLLEELDKERIKSAEQLRLLEEKKSELRSILEQKIKGDEQIERLTALLDASGAEIVELRGEIDALKSLRGQKINKDVYGQVNMIEREETMEKDIEEKSTPVADQGVNSVAAKTGRFGKNQNQDVETSMPSMIRKIKERGSRKKVDFSKRDIPIEAIVPVIVYDVAPISCAPPPKTKEAKGKERVIDVDDVIVNKKSRTALSLARLKQSKVWRNELSSGDRGALEVFWENTTEGDALWENNEGAIGKMEIADLMRCTTITSNVIDCYLSMIAVEDMHKNSLLMSTLTWECVRRDDRNGIRYQLFEPLLDAWGSVHKIYIPIALDQEMHFVFLEVDKINEKATLYDTLKPWNTNHATYATVKKMLSAIEEVLNELKLNSYDWIKAKHRTTISMRGFEKTEKITKRMMMTLKELSLRTPVLRYVIAEECPHQPGRSLDCGIAVMYMIETLSRGQQVQMRNNKEFMEKMTIMRGHMIHRFINHKLSWRHGNPLTDVRAKPIISELSTQIEKKGGIKRKFQ